MFGLKIFVRVQTFQRGPPVPPHNFCHPGTQYTCVRAFLTPLLLYILILIVFSRMNYAELLSTLAPNIHADSLTPVYIGLDIDLKDATSFVALNLALAPNIHAWDGSWLSWFYHSGTNHSQSTTRRSFSTNQYHQRQSILHCLFNLIPIWYEVVYSWLKRQ